MVFVGPIGYKAVGGWNSCSAFQVVENLATAVAISEFAIRPLIAIEDPIGQREAFKKAVEAAQMSTALYNLSTMVLYNCTQNKKGE